MGEYTYQQREGAPPGSDAALEQGCRCPALDNGRVRGGFGGGAKDEHGTVLYWTAGVSPLHGERDS